jgi:hypothetical protein
VEDEGVNVGTKLRDDERHAVDDQARNEVHVRESRSSLETITGRRLRMDLAERRQGMVSRGCSLAKDGA